MILFEGKFLPLTLAEIYYTISPVLRWQRPK
jgi:hypothetical protein